MIPLMHLTIVTTPENNQKAVGVAFIMPPGLPVGIKIVGFNDREELPEIADYLHEQVMYLYNNWDKVEDGISAQTDIPDDVPSEFLEAWDDERKEG